MKRHLSRAKENEMRIVVREQHMQLDESVRETISRRLGFALSRFAEQIRSTEVQVADVNGPRGGIDKRCTVAVRMAGAGTVVVEHEDSDPHVAVARAFERAGRAVARLLERRREVRKHGLVKSRGARPSCG
jgi:putative sigma-54 modulation protein